MKRVNSKVKRAARDEKHHHVVMFSGGIGSYCAARRVVQRYGTEHTTLLFCDTLMEDEDLYRFVDDAARVLAAPLVRLSNGESVWDVFRRVKFLGNTRSDPCSRALKREPSARFLRENFTPETVTAYVGIDWTEDHRYARLSKRHLPWRYKAPMCEAPFLSRKQMFDLLRQDGIEPPRLYAMGFPHNNCGGFCVKAGHAHFRNLLRAMPERYAHHEEQERLYREATGKDYTILRDRKGGVSSRLSLRALRERVESAAPLTEQEKFDWGGCGCFSDEAADASG